jgi:tRNA(Ile)-lysidine synthase
MPSSDVFIGRFHAYNRQHHLIADGMRIIVAVSGGVDSTVLADLLVQERSAMGLQLTLAHMNHGLRGGESDGDEQFVRELGKRYGCEVHVERVDTAAEAAKARTGIQETARTLRYEFLGRLRESLHCDAVATAHHADDNAETMLLHFIRGTGLRGLAGIPLQRDDGGIIRPLGFATREEILSYAAERKLSFRSDSSNEEDHYTRNIIRHRLLPVIRKEINPSVASQLLRSAELFRDVDVYLRTTAKTILADLGVRGQAAEWNLAIGRLSELPELLQQYVVMAVLEEAAKLPPTSALVDAVLDLKSRETGSRVHLGNGWEVSKDRDLLMLRKSEVEKEFSVEIVRNRQYKFGSFVFTMEEASLSDRRSPEPGRVEYVDAGRVGDGALLLRSWHEGEWFIPLGMSGKKKVSDFLIDAHVPLHEKKRHPVLTTASGDVVWLCGLRIDDRFKLTSETRNMLKLCFIPGDT